jgi:glycogen debranching enzyme
MRILHSVNDAQKEGVGHGSFLLGDATGGYLSLGDNDSQYHGWLTYHNGSMYKTIEAITLDKETTTIHNEFSHVERDSGTTTERFYLDDDTLLYDIHNYHGDIHVTLDCRYINDTDDEGRIYDVYDKEGNVVVIHYTKYATGALERKQHERYIAIKNVGSYDAPDTWTHRHYDYDERRHDRSDCYVYHGIDLPVAGDKRMVITQAETEHDAIAKANDAWHHYHQIQLLCEEQPIRAFDLETDAALNALYNLHGPDGFFAGYPWFYQYWRRDMLISLAGLLIADDYMTVKNICMDLVRHVHSDGFMNNMPDGDLRSADAPGWLFLRLHQLMRRVNVYDYFTRAELDTIYDVLAVITEGIKDHYWNGLVLNGPKETWMDTAPDGSGREGAKIEIQALFLRTFRFGAYLADLLDRDDIFTQHEHNLKHNTRNYLYKDDDLWDGAQDPTLRPNIFLAYYAYPSLLSDQEWRTVFDRVIDACWLDWGGFSSISTDHDAFTPYYTGQTNESYHQGDSWYFVNNIAAWSMYDLNALAYHDEIDAIANASIHDMLYQGFVGHCSEVSSAAEQRAEGCRAQAWSAATLAELLHTIRH